MSKRFVYGAYSTFDEADLVAEDLIAQGIQTDSISIIANETSDVPTTSNKHVMLLNHNYHDVAAEKSWWDELLGFFQPNDEDEFTSEAVKDELGNDYVEYQSALHEGQYLIVVDKSYERLIDSHRHSSDFIEAIDSEKPVERTGRHMGPNTTETDTKRHTNMPFSEKARRAEKEHNGATNVPEPHSEAQNAPADAQLNPNQIAREIPWDQTR